VHDYSSGKVEKREATPDEIEVVEQYRSDLIEGIIEESEDADLMDRYLEGDVLKTDELVADLLLAVQHGRFYPVIPVTSVNGLGTEELLRVIEASFPAPGSHAPVTTPDGRSAATGSAITRPAGRRVIRTTSDQFAGRLGGAHLQRHPVDRRRGARVDTALFTGKADPAPGPTRTSASARPFGRAEPVTCGGGIVLRGPGSPRPPHPVVEGQAPADRTLELPSPCCRWRSGRPPATTRTSNALARLAVEDTTVRVERTVETDQIVLWTMGQAHIDLLLNRLKDRYGVSVETEDIKVALRETFVSPAKAMGRHVKQSGGHGQYAVCQIEVEPLPRGEGFKFVDKVVGGSVPRQFIPSVEKGCGRVEKGVIAGYPVVDR
jgi:elongation factor G